MSPPRGAGLLVGHVEVEGHEGFSDGGRRS